MANRCFAVRCSLTIRPGRWVYNHRNRRGVTSGFYRKSLPAAVLQRITIEPLSEPVLFGIYPISPGDAASRAASGAISARRYIRSEEAQETQYKFESLTTGFRSGRQHPIPRKCFASRPRLRWTACILAASVCHQPADPQLGPGYLRKGADDVRSDEELTELVAAAQREIARAALDPSDKQYTIKRARVLERYLHSPRFSYTLAQQRRDPDLDPVEDFIRNNPRGHCEYFASALALMLRSQGIPATCRCRLQRG